MIYRYSSRRNPVDQSFLNERLKNASSYDRIAGYFSSSILEVAGEALEKVTGKIRIVCNSDLNILDVETAKAASLAQSHEWRANTLDKLSEPAKARLEKLYKFLQSGKLEVRVLPDKIHGLLHGKAGVITSVDKSKTSFIGSINESKSAWQLNYEILWEDDSKESVEWVQEEFDYLWNHPKAQPLANAVIEDIKRLSKREVVTITKWKETENPASPVIETPVYNSEFGLWAHQKYFVKKAFDEHLSGRGARYILADQVGLGKTLQLALSAMLMALRGDKPILVIAPKTLIWQWQEENMKLLNFPSAVWDGAKWVDENGVKHPSIDPEKAILNCPRRMGIVSQGVIVHGGAVSEKLLERNYECVIVDEAHRARRKNLKKDGEEDVPIPNNLMRFLWKISPKTKNMLLATATPVQLYPIEAYDMLHILALGSEHVLGDDFSRWKKSKREVLGLVQGIIEQPTEFLDRWDWMKSPFPPRTEHPSFEKVRRSLKKKPTDSTLSESEREQLRPMDLAGLKRLNNFFTEHNPFIRHIVRRTRRFLETEIDSETGEPYLKKVEVELYGDSSDDAIVLPSYLSDAYHTAEEFCEMLGTIMKSAGFIRTLLLRRMGSSIEAGRQTVIKFLGAGYDTDSDEEEDNYDDENTGIANRITDKERAVLIRLLGQLESFKDRDPKYEKLNELLFKQEWASLGCIIFSQYFTTVEYFSGLLSQEHPEIRIGVYAGGSKSGYWEKGAFKRVSKEELKHWVQKGEMKIIFGTDSASEGLNLQRLGTLINLDLPWNPTRLEQRKGRIQRIGQIRDKVFVYNMRYRDSVEDRVHDLLSSRLAHIYTLFGQLPDVLEDVWIEVAQGNIERAQQIINEVPDRNPFEIKYDKIYNIDFESCTEVLSKEEVGDVLKKGW